MPHRPHGRGQRSAYPSASPSSSSPFSLRTAGSTPKKGKVAEPGFRGVAPGRGVIRWDPVSVCHQVSTIGHLLSPTTYRPLLQSDLQTQVVILQCLVNSTRLAIFLLTMPEESVALPGEAVPCASKGAVRTSMRLLSLLHQVLQSVAHSKQKLKEYLVVPSPGLRVDRLAHSAQHPQAVPLVLLHRPVTFAHQASDSCWSCVQN